MRKDLLVVLIGGRVKKAMPVQEILTRYGCIVRTRLGIHDAGRKSCSDTGLVILELVPRENEVKKLKRELDALPGVKTRLVSLSV